MGASGGDDDLEQIARIFRDDVLKAMMARAEASPAEIKSLVDKIQSRLDMFKTLIDDEELSIQPRTASSSEPVAAASRPSMEMPLGEDLGRNQRSRLREIVVLSALEQEKRAYPLQQLMSVLRNRGFDDSKGAVVSHLHRLKALELVDMPSSGSGMYSITPQGLIHLQRLRTDFGHLLR